MEVLKNKSYRSYTRLSRYASFPYYYNELDDKYIGAVTAYLKDTTTYSVHTVTQGDTYDSLALYYYNNPTYYWIICSFNRIQDPFIEPEVGTTLRIPSISTIQFDKK